MNSAQPPIREWAIAGLRLQPYLTGFIFMYRNKLATGLRQNRSFNVGNTELMFCLEPQQPNPQLANLAGMFFGPQNVLYILTTDGKYYAGNIFSGVITEVTQTQLPLISGNLRGDMASCVKKIKKHHDYGSVHQDD
jgi:hypothetical protein